MKYLEYTPLDCINEFQCRVNLGERTIKGCLEPYSCKHTGPDKNLSFSLENEISSSLALVDAVERYTQLHSYPLHRTNKPGILSVDIHNSKDIIATGGVDTHAVVFNRTSGEILYSAVTRKRCKLSAPGSYQAVVSDIGPHEFENFDGKMIKLEEGIEKVIYGCRFLTILAVWGSLVGSFLCFIKAKLRAAMEKVFWDSVVDSLKNNNYERLLNL